MTEHDFCLWLKGLLAVRGAGQSLTIEQTQAVREKLDDALGVIDVTVHTMIPAETMMAWANVGVRDADRVFATIATAESNP